jgi:hypothetical protein
VPCDEFGLRGRVADRSRVKQDLNIFILRACGQLIQNRIQRCAIGENSPGRFGSKLLDAEVIAVCLKTESVRSLLPLVAEFVRQLGSG